MLPSKRLLTLIGIGGSGKTRLALQVAQRQLEAFADGVWFVDLAPITEGEVVPMAIATAISAPSVRGNDALSDVVAHLGGRTALLILDNCEHLAVSVATLVADLRRRCPAIGLVATSRVPLGLIGEHVYRLRPLDAGDIESAAVQLFLERSGRTDEAEGAELDDVARLCRAVDGLPLAIELAATRAHLLTAGEMADRMRTSVSVIATRDPSVPERQRSLDRLLDWSIGLLSPDELLVLCRLAVPADGFDLALAEAVAAGDPIPGDAVPELVWSLLDWSLLIREVAAGESRYSLFWTVRSYVLQHADPADIAAARRRLAEVLLERLGPERSSSAGWSTRLAVEIENVRAVAADLDTDDDIARSLAWSIGQYHDMTSTFRSGIDEIARCVSRRPTPSPVLVALLTLQADLHLRLGEVDAATALVTRAAAMADAVGVPEWDDMCLVRTQGEVALRADDPALAARLADEALARGTATKRSEARLWNLAALARYALGDLTGVAAALDQGLAAEEAAGLESFLVNTHGNYAEMLLELGDARGAAQHQLAALDLGRSIGQAHVVAFSFVVAARFALEDGDAVDAVRLQAAADVIIAHEGHSLYDADQQAREALLDAARARLGPEEFEQASADGASAPVDRLATQTEEILRRRAAPPPTPGGRP